MVTPGLFLRHLPAGATRQGLALSLAASLILPLQVSAQPPANPERSDSKVTLPFRNHHGRVFLPARINGSGPHYFLMDTGFDLTMLDPRLAESLDLKQAGTIAIIGIAGRERARLYRGARFDFDGMKYAPRRVATLKSHSRRERKGVLGSSFYKRFVVEVNYQDDQVHLHDPDDFKYAGPGQILELEFTGETPVVRAAVAAPGRKPATLKFELDTGCDGGLCLGEGFLDDKPWLLADGKARRSGRNGVGGSVKTEEGAIPELHLGTHVVKRPSAHFFQNGSPASKGMAGHIGCEILRQFKVILDYRHQRLILESPQKK